MATGVHRRPKPFYKPGSIYHIQCSGRLFRSLHTRQNLFLHVVDRISTTDHHRISATGGPILGTGYLMFGRDERFDDFVSRVMRHWDEDEGFVWFCGFAFFLYRGVSLEFSVGGVGAFSV